MKEKWLPIEKHQNKKYRNNKLKKNIKKMFFI